MESMARMRVGEPLMLTQLFETVYGSKNDDNIKIPPQYVDFFAEKEFIAWSSTEATPKLDSDVAAVVRAIPWKKGNVPDLWQAPTIKK